MVSSCVSCVVGRLVVKKVFHVGIIQIAPASHLRYLLSQKDNIWSVLQ
jgi:hypothetical protein